VELAEEPPPLDVELDRESALTVRWQDGTESRYGLEELRINCPCAECRGRREQGEPAWPLPGSPHPLKALGGELVGNFGLSIRWNDGHDTGIYNWALLRAWTR